MTKNKKRSRSLRQLKKREFVLSIKQQGCANCGTMDDLTFHHIKDKQAEISDMLSRRGCSLSKLEEEIKKCIILCRHCHNKVHANPE